MMTQTRNRSVSVPDPVLALLRGAVTLCLLSLAGLAQAMSAGTVTHLSGTLSAKRADGSSKLLAVNSEVAQGDLLSTEAQTYARIKFVDGGEVVMRPGTQLKIDRYAYSEAAPQQDNVLLSLFKGGLRAVTGLIGKRNQDKVNFATATATIGIRGTHFGALLCQGDCADVPTTSGTTPADGLHVDVVSGAIVVTNPAGSVVVNTGQFGFTAGFNITPVIVPPQNGIQVTMPNAIAQNKGSGGSIGSSGAGECKI